MGWSYGWNSKEELVEYLTKSWGHGTCLAKSIRGKVLWSVWEFSPPKEEKTRYIRCDLLDKYDDSWGYKDMDESMGPYYYNCPLSYLDMAPVANEKWREGVRDYHEKHKSKRGKSAEVVLAFNSIDRAKQRVKITLERTSIHYGFVQEAAKYGRRTDIYILANNGRRYRVTPKFIGEISIVER